MFFSFDGIDGAGKSTQSALFCDWLTTQGYELVTCRDPGSTPLGERVRELLLHSGDDVPIARTSEMLLYMAARAQLVEQVIRPAIEAGKAVVCDRYLLANVVYQGHAGGLSPDVIWQVGKTATGGLMPDAVFLLDMPTDAASRRIDRPLDRMERQGDAFRERLREGYLAEAKHRPEVVVIDARQTIEAVQAAIQAAATPFLPKAAPR